MNITTLAFRAATVLAVLGVSFGCARPDLTITDLQVVECSGDEIRYSFSILNRDYSGNQFVRPSAVSANINFQAWLSSTTSLNEFDAGDQPAGGGSLRANRDYGSDDTLSPGETASGTFSGGGTDINLNTTPNLILKVDPRNLFDPDSTKDGVISEYSEANNERWIRVASCN